MAARGRSSAVRFEDGARSAIAAFGVGMPAIGWSGGVVPEAAQTPKCHSASCLVISLTRVLALHVHERISSGCLFDRVWPDV
jgi:hypothetical protein